MSSSRPKFPGCVPHYGRGCEQHGRRSYQRQEEGDACIKQFGEGNFEAPLEKFPGKKAFINDTIEQMRTNLKALIADANTLVQAAVQGRLETRADAANIRAITARSYRG